MNRLLSLRLRAADPAGLDAAARATPTPPALDAIRAHLNGDGSVEVAATATPERVTLHAVTRGDDTASFEERLRSAWSAETATAQGWIASAEARTGAGAVEGLLREALGLEDRIPGGDAGLTATHAAAISPPDSSSVLDGLFGQAVSLASRTVGGGAGRLAAAPASAATLFLGSVFATLRNRPVLRVGDDEVAGSIVRRLHRHRMIFLEEEEEEEEPGRGGSGRGRRPQVTDPDVLLLGWSATPAERERVLAELRRRRGPRPVLLDTAPALGQPVTPSDPPRAYTCDAEDLVRLLDRSPERGRDLNTRAALAASEAQHLAAAAGIGAPALTTT